MFLQTLQSGFRQIWRRPLLPVMNILGLAAGIAVAVVIFLYASVELNYNSWVSNQKNLYRVEGQFLGSPNGGYSASTMTPLAPAISENISEASSSVRLWRPFRPVKKDQFLNYETLTFTDPGFFDMFPLELIEGSVERFFDAENRVMISETMATKYFGTHDVIGQTIELDGGHLYTVHGLFKDLPSTSDFNINFVAKILDERVGGVNNWDNQRLQTFVRLHQGSNIADVEEKLAVLVDEHRPFTGSAPGDMREIFRFFLQPFKDIHLGSSGRTSEGSIGNYATIYGFIALATLIISISIFNYISLATARAVEREKEFCLRKISGASVLQIIRHVMVEMTAQTIPAVIVGLLIAADLLPFFSNFIGVDYSLDLLLTPQAIAIIVFGTIALSVTAGLYPSIIISRFRPIKFLSGGRSLRPGVARMRAALVFLQFTVAIALIIGTVTISRQMTFISEVDLGFEPQNLSIIRGIQTRSDRVRSETFRDRVQSIEGVVNASRSSIVPNDNRFYYESFAPEHANPDNGIGARIIASDFNFIETLGANMIAGRALSSDFADDKANMFSYAAMREQNGSKNIVINAEAARSFGFATADSAIGKQVSMRLEPEGRAYFTIVGVVDNVTYESARQAMEHRVYTYYEPRFDNLSVRTIPGRGPDVITEIQRVWTDMYPDTPFRVHYAEERIESLYSAERQQLKLFITFSVLAIILSLIGLVGLVLNSIIHRTREISIRRVLGASARDNIKLFTWQYLKPVIISNIPAWAVSYYFLTRWLSKYPERIDLNIDLYLIGSSIVIAATTLLVIAIVAKIMDTPPALALKQE